MCFSVENIEQNMYNIFGYIRLLLGYKRVGGGRLLKGGIRIVSDWFKTLKHLSWLTQAGISVAAPLILCIGGGIWLAETLPLGHWPILIGVVLGIGGALCSLLGFFKVISIESKRKSNKQPGAFNK